MPLLIKNKNLIFEAHVFIVLILGQFSSYISFFQLSINMSFFHHFITQAILITVIHMNQKYSIHSNTVIEFNIKGKLNHLFTKMLKYHHQLDIWKEVNNIFFFMIVIKNWPIKWGIFNMQSKTSIKKYKKQ